MPQAVYLASYKATQPGALGLVNRAIRFFTKSQYSHSEMAIGNPFDAPVLCVSSVGVEGGVRAKTMQLNPTKWDLIELHHITPADVQAFLAQHQGKGYDFVGCVRSVLPFVGREHPDHWFCSEVCAAIIGHPEPWRMHPGVLHAVELSRTKPRPPQ
jgi:hypothetical protein